MDEVKVRSKEKAAELNDYHVLRNEYEHSMENLSKVIQQLQSRSRQGHVKVVHSSIETRHFGFIVAGFND